MLTILLIVLGVFGAFMYTMGCAYTKLKIEKEVNKDWDEIIDKYEIVTRKR